MEKLRKYGEAPFSIAVVHGGPGAPGEMAPVARELSSVGGVLEPLQSAMTLEGQVAELKEVLLENAELPVTLLGFSWGALLGFILAARYPDLVKKLILISGAPYEDRYAVDIMNIRLARLEEPERREARRLMKSMGSDNVKNENILMVRFGELMFKADAFELLPYNSEVLECQPGIYKNVWEQAARLRSSGELLALGRMIKCPVVAIHGDYDPHPIEGVTAPLSLVLGDFRFYELARCGHYPWLERYARDNFYKILKQEV